MEKSFKILFCHSGMNQKSQKTISLYCPFNLNIFLFNFKLILGKYIHRNAVIFNK